MFDLEDEDEEEMAKVPFLHIHGQSHWHEDVFIIGNHEALIQLHKAITSAIKKGEGHTESFFCGDGEGYKIKIKDVGESDLSKMDLPYSDVL